MYFISYNDESNKLAMRSTGDHFPNDVYDKGVDHVPAYPTGDDANGYIYFTSREPFMVNIDYGDGEKGQKIAKKRTEGDYIVVLGSMNIPYYKNPNGGEWGTLESGGKVGAEFPHIYTDGKTEHNVAFNFTAPIKDVKYEKVYCDQFPTIDMPTLQTFKASAVGMKNTEVPADRLRRIDSLKEFVYETVFNKSGGGSGFYLEFPVGLFKAPNIEVINMNLVCDLNGKEESLRGIKNCSKITQFSIRGSNGYGCRKYLKEFNELPLLRTLDIAGSENYHIDVSEVNIINPSLIQFIFLQGGGCSSNCLSHWREEFSGMGLEKIIKMQVDNGSYIPVDILPEYFKEMRAMFTFSGVYDFVRYNNRLNTFVDTWYDYVTSWDQITMSSTAKDSKRNQFYGIYMDFYTSYYPYTERPSGILQAPEGFVKGSTNGNPQSPMEKIYVLTNNYGENWHLKPASTSARTAQLFEMVFVDDRAIIGDGDLITSFPKEYCYSKEEAVSLCKEHGVDEKPVIEWFENRGVGIPED